MIKVKYTDIGLISYEEAWEFQKKKVNEILNARLNNPNSHAENLLILCEHPHVYTLGKSGSESNLLIDSIQLIAKNANFIRTDRGGDITYHGPGQIVGYPILDLELLGMGVKQYVSKIEDTIIETLKEYSIKGKRLDGATGVWLDVNTKNVRKICAIGVKVSRAVTMHGFAFNVNTDLSYFSYINPCGFTDKPVTSLEKELGQKQDIEKVKMILKAKIEEVFGVRFIS